MVLPMIGCERRRSGRVVNRSAVAPLGYDDRPGRLEADQRPDGIKRVLQPAHHVSLAPSAVSATTVLIERVHEALPHDGESGGQVLVRVEEAAVLQERPWP